jgi:hypothetical protein
MARIALGDHVQESLTAVLAGSFFGPRDPVVARAASDEELAGHDGLLARASGGAETRKAELRLRDAPKKVTTTGLTLRPFRAVLPHSFARVIENKQFIAFDEARIAAIDVAAHACRHEIGSRIIRWVEVEMIDCEVIVFRVTARPPYKYQAASPMTQVGSWPDGVVKNHPVCCHHATRGSEDMPRIIGLFVSRPSIHGEMVAGEGG